MAESPRDKEQQIQAALNQAKKLELQQKYGAHFSEASNLPPDVEGQWLNYIEEFERQFEHSREITVREFLGNPAFQLLGGLLPEKLGSELSSVLEFLDLHGVVVDCVAEVSDEELYRFVTTEFLDAEISDIRIPGMTHHFIYEEFHPNDEYDAKSSAENFLSDLFAREEEWVMHHLPKEEEAGPAASGGAHSLKNDIHSFYSRFASFPHHEVECTNCRLDGEFAIVNLNVRWVGLRSDSLEKVSYSGTCKIRLRKSPYGLYDVLQANIPGFS
ncbi:MAG: hypothetical protein WEF53_00005 [Bacteroidota bacterium]